MMGNPKFHKAGLREIALSSTNRDGGSRLILPLPLAKEEEEVIGNALQARVRSRNSQCKSPQILLIECMLERMCANYEDDPAKQKELYEALRRYLVKFRLLPKVKEIPEMETLRVHFASDLNKLFCLAKREISVRDPSSLATTPLAVATPSPLSGTVWASIDGREHLFTSRYELDFEELEFIAAGGFGVVYKAKNILDDKEYAIKKIVIKPNSASKIIREVQLLSSFHHPNIVAYKSAWLEYCSPQTLRDLIHRMEGSPFGSQGKNSSESTTEGSPSFDVKSSRAFISDQSQSIVFERSSTTELSVQHDVRTSTSSNSSSTKKIVSVSSSSMFLERTSSYVYWDRVVTPSVMLLYIQMQLCPQTLRHWLNVRNRKLISVEDALLEVAIFRQILQGIIYIHSNNIIHRDIKPDNIFIDEKHQVQIGDFGLAKLRFDNSTSSIVRPMNRLDNQTTRGVGTHSYAAPEQLENKESDSKSDVYSLGIVLLELLCPFRTDMERHITIKNLRENGVVPAEITEKWPFLAALILKMISQDPGTRPLATEVLAELGKNAVANKQNPESSTTDDTSDTVSQLLLVIESLKKEIAEKNLIIEKLTSGGANSVKIQVHGNIDTL